MSAQPGQPSLDELAAEPVDDEDVRVLQQLASIYTKLDPVPTGLVDRITFGMTLDALHAEIAQLQRSADLVGIRGEAVGAQSQSVTFTSASLTTMVTITPTSADRARIDGWIDPGAPWHVELRTPAGAVTTQADVDGRFVLESVPRGLVQLVVRGEDERSRPPVIAPSIEI